MRLPLLRLLQPGLQRGAPVQGVPVHADALELPGRAQQPHPLAPERGLRILAGHDPQPGHGRALHLHAVPAQRRRAAEPLRQRRLVLLLRQPQLLAPLHRLVRQHERRTRVLLRQGGDRRQRQPRQRRSEAPGHRLRRLPGALRARGDQHGRPLVPRRARHGHPRIRARARPVRRHHQPGAGRQAARVLLLRPGRVVRLQLLGRRPARPGPAPRGPAGRRHERVLHAAGRRHGVPPRQRRQVPGVQLVGARGAQRRRVRLRRADALPGRRAVLHGPRGAGARHAREVGEQRGRLRRRRPEPQGGRAGLRRHARARPRPGLQHRDPGHPRRLRPIRGEPVAAGALRRHVLPRHPGQHRRPGEPRVDGPPP